MDFKRINRHFLMLTFLIQLCGIAACNNELICIFHLMHVGFVQYVCIFMGELHVGALGSFWVTRENESVWVVGAQRNRSLITINKCNSPIRLSSHIHVLRIQGWHYIYIERDQTGKNQETKKEMRATKRHHMPYLMLESDFSDFKGLFSVNNWNLL